MEDRNQKSQIKVSPKRYVVAIWACICIVIVPCLQANTQAAEIPEKLSLINTEVRAALISGIQKPNTDDAIEVVVFFEEALNQGPLSKINAMPTNMSARRKLVVNSLRSFKSSREESTLNQITSISGVVLLGRHWVTRSAVIKAPISELIQIAGIDGVSRVVENVHLEYVASVEESESSPKLSAGVSDALQKLSIPQLWAQGLTGKGRIVANFDTGVEGTHPALANNYRGANATSAESFFAPNSNASVSFDNIGHGTHTMGIMVGHTPTDSFGVAPAAEWISAAVVDQGNSLGGTLSDILGAFEWALDPDGNPNTTDDMPDVILNSWGLPVGLLGPCDNTFWDAIDNVEQAGIVTIFAAGNEGPNPYTIRSPANRIASPLNSFAIGAVDQNTMQVASFSSRGPSTCDSVTIKPEVVAPGILIHSADKGGGYKLRSGTSMSAPFIAGLVALLRQYNPNATVAQIKQAIIGSAADLGPLGNDNAYGHGMPDAVRALALIPPLTMPQVYVTDVHPNGDGIAAPGETTDMQILIQAPIGAYDTLHATLRTQNENQISIINGTALFLFSPATGAGSNLAPFVIQIADSLAHGSSQTLILDYNNSFGGSGSVSVEMTIGATPEGALYTHTTPALQLTVSDFGQFGLGANSAYQAGGAGLRFQGSENLLYESGIIVGRNTVQLASAVRDSNAVSFFSDFSPTQPLNFSLGSEGSSVSEAQYTDRYGRAPIPLGIKQKTTTYNTPSEAGYAIIEFTLHNSTLEPMTGLHFAFFNDFDLGDDPSLDNINYDPGLNMLYQYRDGIAVALVALSQTTGIVSGRNSSTKAGFSINQIYSMLTTDSLALDNSGPDDYYAQMNFGPYNIPPLDSVKVALAIVAGADLVELADYATKARNRFLLPTGIEDDNALATLPQTFELAQNYPNPFNPSTTIEFSAPKIERAQVTVFNVLGQAVKTVFDGQTEIGLNRITWDGKDNNGSTVASGIYFYRLKTANNSLTRKMTLLK